MTRFCSKCSAAIEEGMRLCDLCDRTLDPMQFQSRPKLLLMKVPIEPFGIGKILLVVTALAIFGYQAIKFIQVDNELDFRVIWVAGSLWLKGLDPYGEAFEHGYRTLIGGRSIYQLWFYPPHWAPLTELLALLPLHKAIAVWNGVNLACMLAATWLVASAVATGRGGARWIWFCGGLILVGAMQGTAIASVFGQTSFLMYLGWALVVRGLVGNRQALLVAGLFIVSLKPNVGIVWWAAVLAAGHWRAILAAAVAVVGALTPALAAQGLGAIIGFVRNLNRYATPEMLPNLPPDLCGLIHLIHRVTGVVVPAPLLACVAALLAAAIVRAPGSAPRSRLAATALATALAMLLVPLHSYDLQPLVLPFLATFALRPNVSQILLGAGVLVIVRARNLAELTGVANPESVFAQGAWLESLALLTLLPATAWVWREARYLPDMVERIHSHINDNVSGYRGK